MKTMMKWLLPYLTLWVLGTLTANAQPPIDTTCICTQEYAPVCVFVQGDTLSFPNACYAECLGFTANQYFACEGTVFPPPPPPDTCNCPAIWAPVCITTPEGICIQFSNSCQAMCAGFIDFHPCDSLPPVDTTNLCDAFFFHYPINEGLTLQFESFSGGIDPITYVWSFGDGSTATEQSPVHTYADAGAYEVTLTVTDATGCVSTFSQTTYVGDNPIDTSGCICPDVYDPVCVFTPDGFEWHFPNSCYAECAGFYNYVTCDSFPTDTTGCICPAVYDPVCVFTPNGGLLEFSNSCYAECAGFYDYVTCDTFPPIDTTDYCYAYFGYYANDDSGLSLQFEDYSFTYPDVIENWQWTFGDGTTSTEQNPTHTYAAEGAYDVTLTINTVEGCESTTTYNVYVGDWGGGWPGDSTIYANCQALFYFNQNDPADALTLQFVDASYAENITSWQWVFGDGGGSTQANPTHTYSQAGYYTVTLVITSIDAAGETCFSAYNVDIYVGDTFWYPDSCQAFFYPNIVFGTDSLATSLTVEFLNFSFMTDNNTTCSWDFGDGNTSTDCNPTHTYAAPGTYDVTLTIAGENCFSGYVTTVDLEHGLVGHANAFSALISSTKDTKEHSVISQVKAFPNPATDQIRVNYTMLKQSDLNISVQSLNGQTLLQTRENVGAGTHETALTISSLPAGMYIVRVVSNDESITTKFVKQ